MNKETEKLLITVLKKLNSALDIYLKSNKNDHWRIIVINTYQHGDASMLIYKTTSKKLKGIFYYDTDIAEILGIDYSDFLDMSNKVLDYIEKSGDFEYVDTEYASDYLQKELWRIDNPTEFLDNGDGSTSDVFNFRLCAQKYLIPKYQLSLKY